MNTYLKQQLLFKRLLRCNSSFLQYEAGNCTGVFSNGGSWTQEMDFFLPLNPPDC